MQTIIVAALLLAVCGVPQSKDIDIANYNSVIVIPDIHGDWEATLTSLYIAYRIAENDQPNISLSDFTSHVLGKGHRAKTPLISSNRVLLVQLGDIAHRGKRSYLIYKAFNLLEKILNWKIISLAGNHEFMAHLGTDDKFVHPQEHVGYGGRKERKKAFKKNGEIWKIIRDKYGLVARIAPKINHQNSQLALDHPNNPSMMFMHAGIDLDWFNSNLPIYDFFENQSLPVINIDKLNSMFSTMLDDKDQIESILMDSSSPVWTRDFSNSSDRDLCEKLLPIIQKLFQVSRFVVGHSADQKNRSVRTRCNNHIILADFAMSKGVNNKRKSYGGIVFFKFADLTNHGGKHLVGAFEIHADGMRSFGIPDVKASQVPVTVSAQHPVLDTVEPVGSTVTPSSEVVRQLPLPPQQARQRPAQQPSEFPASQPSGYRIDVSPLPFPTDKKKQLEKPIREPLNESPKTGCFAGICRRWSKTL